MHYMAFEVLQLLAYVQLIGHAGHVWVVAPGTWSLSPLVRLSRCRSLQPGVVMHWKMMRQMSAWARPYRGLEA